MRSPEEWMALLETVADEADTMALRFFRHHALRVWEKPDSSPVSEADEGIETRVREIVRRHSSELGVLGEEQGEADGGSPWRLIIDPIDGTSNFVRGDMHFATLLAIEGAGEIVAGVISAPALGQRWMAARGSAAWCGSKRLRVSRVAQLEGATLLGGKPVPMPAPVTADGGRGLLERAARVRHVGDFYRHVAVAEGVGDAAVHTQVAPWDIAPMVILVEEAGGRATTAEGRRSIYDGSLLTSNGLLHEECVEIIRRTGIPEWA